MELLLAVATLVVAAAVLYVTITVGQRTKRTAAPLIDGVSGQLEATSAELRRQLQAVVNELHQDADQLRLDGRKIQGRLDHADSRLTTVANQLLAELDTIKRLGEQLSARQDQLSEELRQLDRRPHGE
jgi:chromosome segregation ATPase